MKIQILLLKISCWFAVCCIFGQANGQTDSLRLRRMGQLDSTIHYFTTDALQNLYTVDAYNTLRKYNSNKEFQFLYSNNTLGTLSYIDASDPFNLLLFYADYRNVILLDRTLSLRQDFELFNLNVIDIGAVAVSSDKQLWVYDDINFRIIKVDPQGEIVMQSSNLSLLFPFALQVKRMIEHNNRLYLYDLKEGLFIFDIFGNFIKRIAALQEIEHFQLVDEQFIYAKLGKLYAYDLTAMIERQINVAMPLDSMAQVRIEKDRLYVKVGPRVEIYLVD